METSTTTTPGPSVLQTLQAPRCPHESFTADVNVHVARAPEGSTFTTILRVKCAQCGLPFVFDHHQRVFSVDIYPSDEGAR